MFTILNKNLLCFVRSSRLDIVSFSVLLLEKIQPMHLDTLLQFTATLPGTEDSFPFDAKTLVLKVGGKMYLLVDAENPKQMNLKCDPERAIELRERYDGIQPGYHMNKKHWNTVDLQGSVDEKLIFELVKHSYELVFASLPKKVRDEFAH